MIGTIVLAGTLFLAYGSFSGDHGQASLSDSDLYDCGAIALYHLLALEDKPTELDRLEDRLSGPKPKKRSLQELRDCAKFFGLELKGVLLPKTGLAPETVALVHLKRKPDGHFVVIRPVGHSGTFVQVFDGLRSPVIVDAKALYNSPEWTGFALIPDRPNWPARIAVGLAVASALALAATLLAPRLRDARRNRPAPMPPQPA